MAHVYDELARDADLYGGALKQPGKWNLLRRRRLAPRPAKRHLEG
jgi:hypothetical protein